jgi:hypothetical protein
MDIMVDSSAILYGADFSLGVSAFWRKYGSSLSLTNRCDNCKFTFSLTYIPTTCLHGMSVNDIIKYNDNFTFAFL